MRRKIRANARSRMNTPTRPLPGATSKVCGDLVAAVHCSQPCRGLRRLRHLSRTRHRVAGDPAIIPVSESRPSCRLAGRKCLKNKQKYALTAGTAVSRLARLARPTGQKRVLWTRYWASSGSDPHRSDVCPDAQRSDVVRTRIDRSRRVNGNLRAGRVAGYNAASRTSRTDQRRVAPHCTVVNLVRSGRKQPQRFNASAGGTARHPSLCSPEHAGTWQPDAEPLVSCVSDRLAPAGRRGPRPSHCR